MLDALARGESVTITRNNTVLGTINPPVRAVTLREAFERLPKMSPDVAGLRAVERMSVLAAPASVTPPGRPSRMTPSAIVSGCGP